MPAFQKSLVWFRRDLRSFDHAALYHALKQSRAVVCVFIFDREILAGLAPADRRVGFIHASVMELDAELKALGSRLIVRHALATQEIPRLAEELAVDAVFVNRDYEPSATARDAAVADRLRAAGRPMFSLKDQTIFDGDEVLSLAGKPFSVFTPYKNAWMKKLQAAGGDFFIASYPIDPYVSRLAPADSVRCTPPSLAELGFEPADMSAAGIAPGMSGGQAQLDDFLARIDDYHTARDFPAINGSSRLSVHLRFGTVSIRGLARRALDAMRTTSGGSGAATWLSELIWRDFYFMILHHHPHVAVRAFKPEYDHIQWETGEAARQRFDAWRQARTGYPLVDAAMVQLNQTGFMHNRLRMVSACFLIKDLGIDWRWGERYFAERLNDYDLAANNGGWQWAASSGCDAQPYFRIFNPVTQSEKFDPHGKFIRRFLPALANVPDKFIHAPWMMSAGALRECGIELGRDYAGPIVRHDEARKATLARYAVVRKVRQAAASAE